MAIIKKKTRKAITKQVKKLVHKHGAEIALGAATALVGSVVAAATGKETKKTKKTKLASGQPTKKAADKKKVTKPRAAKKITLRQKDEAQS